MESTERDVSEIPLPSEPSQGSLGLGNGGLSSAKMTAGLAGSWCGHETSVRGSSWGGYESQVKAGGLEEMHPNVWRMDKQRSHFPGTGNLVLPSSTKFTLKIDCSSIFKDSQTGWHMLAFPWGEIKLPRVSLSSWLAGPGGEEGANKEREQGLTSSVPAQWVYSGRGRSSVAMATSEHHSGTRGWRGKRCWVWRH